MNDELEIRFSDVDGLVGRTILVLMLGLPAVVSLWLSFLAVNQFRIIAGIAPSEFANLQLVVDPATPWQVVGGGVVALTIALVSNFLLARVVALGWRGVRRRWWLRLTPAGFEVNDRLLRPRQYRWSDIDRFVLVGAPAEAQTFIDVLKDGAASGTGLVGFRYLAEHRRRPGRRADGYLMGWWDRPFDQAVDLMNDWLARYR